LFDKGREHNDKMNEAKQRKGRGREIKERTKIEGVSLNRAELNGSCKQNDVHVFFILIFAREAKET